MALKRLSKRAKETIRLSQGKRYNYNGPRFKLVVSGPAHLEELVRSRVRELFGKNGYGGEI